MYLLSNLAILGIHVSFPGCIPFTLTTIWHHQTAKNSDPRNSWTTLLILVVVQDFASLKEGIRGILMQVRDGNSSSVLHLRHLKKGNLLKGKVGENSSKERLNSRWEVTSWLTHKKKHKPGYEWILIEPILTSWFFSKRKMALREFPEISPNN